MHPAIDMDQLAEVSSSMISAVGTKDGYLVVFFQNGDVYRYPDLEGEFSNLVSATSIGKYFHKEIRHQRCHRLPQSGWIDD